MSQARAITQSNVYTTESDQPTVVGASPAAVWEARRCQSSYRAGLVVKRGVDIVVSALLLLLLLPLLAVVALAVRLSSRGPILFRQVRVGRDGEPIKVLKFRSMRPTAEAELAARDDLREEYVANGFTLHVRSDPRVTPVGRILRRSCVDELPQLINVLRGDMSLIGPRPILAEELDLYGDLDWAYLCFRPGVTGLWQVSGRNSVPYDQRVQIDAAYVANWSMWSDVEIALKTPLAVFRGSHPQVDLAALDAKTGARV